MLFGLPRSWERQLGWFSETGNGRSPAVKEGRHGPSAHKRPEPRAAPDEEPGVAPYGSLPARRREALSVILAS